MRCYAVVITLNFVLKEYKEGFCSALWRLSQCSLVSANKVYRKIGQIIAGTYNEAILVWLDFTFKIFLTGRGDL